MSCRSGLKHGFKHNSPFISVCVLKVAVFVVIFGYGVCGYALELWIQVSRSMLECNRYLMPIYGPASWCAARSTSCNSINVLQRNLSPTIFFISRWYKPWKMLILNHRTPKSQSLTVMFLESLAESHLQVSNPTHDRKNYGLLPKALYVLTFHSLNSQLWILSSKTRTLKTSTLIRSLNSPTPKG